MFLRACFLLCVSLTAAAQAPSSADAATPLSYELVSIHKSKPDATGYALNNTPDGLNARAINLREVVSEAYGFTFGDLIEEQIIGLPSWGRTQRFDIRAKVDDSDVERLKAARKAETMAVWVRSMVERKPTTETAMLQRLVTDYFHLQMHYEQRTMPVFALTVSKGGVKMTAAHPKDPEHGSLSSSNGKLSGENVPADFLVFLLSREAGRPVVNRTNLPGAYDFAMSYTPQADVAKSDASSDAPSIFTALDEQLGLKLVRATEPVWVILVDHVEMPADN
jgi:uncharacterized protein (TIGR03435 family)